MWHSWLRVVVVLLAVAAVPLASTAVPGAPARAAAARPNIVMIMTDDQTLASLSVMPNVTRLLQREGTTFGNAYVSYPLCCPSRATYLTGQYPHNHHVMNNHMPHGGYPKLRGDSTLPVWLSDAGYDTAHVGKYLNEYGRVRPQEVPPGWAEWHGLVGGSAYRMWGYRINHNGTVRQYGEWDSDDPELYQTDVLRDISVDYIDRKAGGGKPFFLSVAPLAPHVEMGDKVRGRYGWATPRPAPRHAGRFADRKLPRSTAFNEADVRDKPGHIRYQQKMDRTAIRNTTLRWRSQLESLLAVDEMVAAIVDKLKAEGQLDNTMIMFTSDNGYFNGEHRIPEGKRHPYDPSIRVPLVMRGPGIPKGRTVSGAVSNVDLAPTILDAADARPRLPQDGGSLLALTRNPRLADDRLLLFENGPGNGDARYYQAVRDNRYMYIRHSTGEVELYDMAKDPRQVLSRHRDPAYKGARTRLAARLDALAGCQGETCGGGFGGSAAGEPVWGDTPAGGPGSAAGGKAHRAGRHAADQAAGEDDWATLPITGLGLGGVVAVGVGLVVTGVLARLRRRRSHRS